MNEKKARIKGTNFDLEIMDAIGSGDYTWRAKHPSARGAYIFIPQEWVEFYTPLRKEPTDRGSVEIDNMDDVWVLYDKGWSCVHQQRGRLALPSDTTKDLTWEELQTSDWGPTRPMKVEKEEEA